MENNQGNKVSDDNIQHNNEIELVNKVQFEEKSEKRENDEKTKFSAEKKEEINPKESQPIQNKVINEEIKPENERKKLMLSYDTEENRDMIKRKINDFFKSDFFNKYEEKNSQFYKDVDDLKISFYNIAVEAELIKSQIIQKPSSAIHKYNKTDLQGNKYETLFSKKPSVNESFLSNKNSIQKDKKFEKIKPNPLTKSVDIDRQGYRSHKTNFNTNRLHQHQPDTAHYNVNLYNTISEKKYKGGISSPEKTPKPKKNTNPKPTISYKDKEKDKMEEKDKSKIPDKMKTTAKIKRPILSIKTNLGSKANTTGYDTNITVNSQAKSPLASNLTSDKSFHEKDKKNKESKDDSFIKHKNSLENNPERGNFRKINENKEKKSTSNTNISEDTEAKKLSDNFNTKKSSSKLIHHHPKKSSEKINEKNEEKEKIDDSKNKKTSDKSLNRSRHEKLKEKKESKSSSKIDKISSNKNVNKSKTAGSKSSKSIQQSKKDENLKTESYKHEKEGITPISNISNRIDIENSEKSPEMSSSESLHKNKEPQIFENINNTNQNNQSDSISNYSKNANIDENKYSNQQNKINVTEKPSGIQKIENKENVDNSNKS